MKRLVSVLLSICLALTLVTGPARATPVAYQGALFSLTATAGTWQQEEAAAVAAGGHLASIHSAAEEQFIINTFLTGAVTPDVFWIGLYDPVQGDGSGAQHAADFVWTDGTPADYTDWNTATGEPNNTNSAEYWTAINWHYAASGSGLPGQWNDMPMAGSDSYSVAVNGPYYGIIEVPEPAGFAVFGLGVAALGLARRGRRRGGMGT